MRRAIRIIAVFALVFIPFLACMDFGGDETEGCESITFEWGDPNGPSDPCRGVVCPSDANVCTREYCSGGSCRSEPVTNGKSCTYGGLSGVCVEGVCGENLCEDVVCEDEPCSTGNCDYVDGLCNYTPRLPNGTACVYDGMDGVCVNGVCGENLCEDVVCDAGDACTDGTCDYVDGTCHFTPAACDDDSPCTEDTCDPVDGCIFTAVEDGTECFWGVGSPPFGVCEAGACVAPCDPATEEVYRCPIEGLEELLCCPGSEYCHDVCGVPECESPEDCDDGNECTDDSCSGRVCENPQVEDGTPCAGGACVAGDCVLSECESAEGCDDGNECTEDTCDLTTGVCNYTAVEDGTECSVGACRDGVCTVLELVGDKDGFGLGLGEGARHTGWFDNREASDPFFTDVRPAEPAAGADAIVYKHIFVPPLSTNTNRVLSMLTLCISDGDDQVVGSDVDIRLFLDDLEVPGAFDDVDQFDHFDGLWQCAVGLVSIDIPSSHDHLLEDGQVTVRIENHQLGSSTGTNAFAIDYSELAFF